MTIDTASRPDLRTSLRRPDDALARASIGTVPILWNNVDLEELRDGTNAATILDEIARTGYEGTQLGLGFPEGVALRDELAHRGLRLAEVYASISATPDGPLPGTLDDATERLRLLDAAGGEVLCVALDGSPDRDGFAGRGDAPDCPVLSDSGWSALVDLVHKLADLAAATGHRTVFHPHAGTYVETPEEVARFVAAIDPARVGICLDVGHYLVGGGDPVALLTELGPRVTHVHLKDVDGDVLERLRDGRVAGFGAAIRERLFTELGAGVLDLDGVVETLATRDYAGWLMVEQDSCWGPPAEAAAIGRRVLAAALRRAGSSGAG
jgi:inosose dehydratase